MSDFFEDVRPGVEVALGSHTFTAEAIKAFAQAYDPQPFHLDERKAARSIFKGLCASGWHTAAVWMRLMVEHELASVRRTLAAGGRPARLGPSPGFTDLRWLKPVRPGDTITYAMRIREKRDWPSKPRWGLVVMDCEGRDAAGELVFAFVGEVLIERRTPAG